MKTFKHLLILCFLAVLAACSEDAFVPQSEEITAIGSGSIDFISMTVPDIEMDATTRSKLYEDGDELKFAWQENDAIGVVPLNGRPLSFPIHAENAGKNTAVFDGGDWALKTSTKYAAFFPYNKEIAEKDIKSIPINYIGQTQSNWMKYDYMATGAIQPKDGAVMFTMQRLSAILKITIVMPAGSTARYGTLIAPSEVFGVKGTLDLSGSEPVYTPEGFTKFINTDAGVSRTSTSAWNYTVYMMVPPANLSGQLLTFRLTSDEGYAYEAILAGKKLEAGMAYTLSGTATDAVIKNANLIAAVTNTTYNPGVSFTLDNNCINVNDNVESIQKVVRIYVNGKDDPSVCDEIGYFKNLTYLYCAENKLTSLDVSNNTELADLRCGINQLTSLDVSKNTALTALVCGENPFTSLDVSKNTALIEFYCYSNQLTSLDVSNNTALTILSCYNNQLTSLDISNNTALTYLSCFSNPLTSLDVSNNTALAYLYCYNNQLTSLDISNNTLLRNLYCYYNQLTSLDVSNNTALIQLYCNSNQLTSLDVSNNTALTDLNCYNNQLTSLDVSNTALKKLSCGGNQLISLDVSNNTALISLQCFSNQLTSLDVSNNTALITLQCYNNQLTSLDVSNCTNLETLNCSSNSFETLTITGLTNLKLLNLSNCTSLTELYCSNNGLTTLSLGNLTSLTKLQCHNNYLSGLNVNTCPALTELYCYKNLMSSLDITKCTFLEKSSVRCGGQYTDSDKTEYKTLTLYARTADTTELRFTNSPLANLNVEVINQ